MSTANGAWLLHGGRVIDGTGAPAREEPVLLADGVVAATGSRAEEEGARRNDVTRLDVAGKTVMPGLIDAHCHISFDSPGTNDELFFHRRQGLAAIIAAHNVHKVLRAGVTGMLDADCIFDTSLDLRDAIDAGYVEGPRMNAGGNALLTSVGGTAGLLFPDEGRRGYGVIVRSRDEIVTEVRRQVKNGVDWIKLHVTGIVPRRAQEGEVSVWSFDELRAACDTAHELGIPVTGHCRNAVSVRDAARAGMDLIYHATFMDEEALEAVVEHKPSIAPTFTFQANLADHGAEVGATPDIIELFRKEIEGSAAMLRRAAEAGVPMLCGSESGFTLTPYGEWHHKEIEVFVDHLGMTPLEAISCATKESARAIKMHGEVGALLEGWRADVIVVDARPDETPSELGRPGAVEHVFIDGRKCDISEPERAVRDVPGWRVSAFATRLLTRDVAGVYGAAQ
ncbi:MAG: amidohydrolase family protein [Caulobacterales bacterium]|nr:amidohydrolase family protein [Caulobacterales bacterium]